MDKLKQKKKQLRRKKAGRFFYLVSETLSFVCSVLSSSFLEKRNRWNLTVISSLAKLYHNEIWSVQCWCISSDSQLKIWSKSFVQIKFQASNKTGFVKWLQKKTKKTYPRLLKSSTAMFWTDVNCSVPKSSATPTNNCCIPASARDFFMVSNSD